MGVKDLPKAMYSEWVVRNSLYWLSPTSAWNLDDGGSHWRVQVAVDEPAVWGELDRLLNDYLLREKLMLATDSIRSEIIQSVFHGIAKRLTP